MLLIKVIKARITSIRPTYASLCSAHLKLHALDTLPLNKHGAKKTQRSQRNGNIESRIERITIRLHDTRIVLSRDDMFELGGTRAGYDVGGEAGGENGHVAVDFVDEDVLGDCDADCAAKGLEENLVGVSILELL